MGSFEPNDQHDIHCVIGMSLDKCIRNKDRLLRRLLYLHNFYMDLGDKKVVYNIKEAII